MQRFSFVTFVFLLTTGSMAGQGSPAPLRDGQQVTLSGVLTMEPAGRLQFVTVKTASAYVPVFQGESGGKDTQGDVLHEIGLAGYFDYGALYAHRGQKVTVTGKLQTDDATPYFWHGTRLTVSSIRLADGVDLLHRRATVLDPIAADTGTYKASVMLPVDLAAPWAYSMNGKPVEEGRFLSCVSNGGGDVVNCFCGKGFHPVNGHSLIRRKREEAGLFKDMSFAQFGVGEDKQPPVVRLTVTCSR